MIARFPIIRSSRCTAPKISPGIDYDRDLLVPRSVPVHARHPPDDVSRPAVDDAPVRRFRHRQADQRALQVLAGAGPDGIIGCLRHARAHGLRLRPSSRARRSRQVRRCHRHAARHARPHCWHRSRLDHDVDDDQLHGAGRARDVYRRGRSAGRSPRQTRRHAASRHAQGIHRAEGVDLSARTLDAHHHRHDGVLCEARTKMEHDLDLGLSHPGSRHRPQSQELAFTLADGFAYVEAGIAAGMDVDDFAPRLSFFFNSHSDFFEEIAKFRAARRIWARHMREKYSAKNPALVDDALPHADRGLLGHRATARKQHHAHGVSGARARSSAARSRCTRTRWTKCSRCRREKNVQIALRTQQIIAYETGVGQRHRSARRLVLCREAHQRDRSSCRGILPRASTSWAA